MAAEETISGRRIQVAKWSELEDRKPAYALVGRLTWSLFDMMTRFPCFTGVASIAGP